MKMRNKTESDLRIEASEAIHSKFKGACVVRIMYIEDGAYAYAIYPDGIKEYTFVPYSLAPRYGQHQHAESVINQITN